MKPQFSVVAPVYNEEGLIQEFYTRVRDVMEGIGEPWELVLVNDGCRDRSPQLLNEIYAQDPEHVVIVHFSRNFGHQTAITAGADYARGEAIAVIDSDLQDPPEVIADMVAKWREGYDVAYAVRAEREGETWFKTFTAGAFYRLVQRITEVEIPLDTGDFRLMDRKVLDVLNSMREQHRFIRGMVSWVGFRQVGVPYARHARKVGETKYTLRKMLRLAFDGITSFSELPLKVSLWAGGLAAGLGVLLALVLLVLRLGGAAPLAGQGLTASLVLFMGGVQLLCVGVLGEYVGRIHGESLQRPLYVVREIKRQDDVV